MFRKIFCCLCVVILTSSSKLRRSYDVFTRCDDRRERNEILDLIKSFTESFEKRAYSRIEEINADLKRLEDTEKNNIKSKVMEMKLEIANEAILVDCPVPSKQSLTGELDSLTELVYDMCDRNADDILDEMYDIINRLKELFHRAQGYIKAARKTEAVNASQLCFRLAKRIKLEIKAVRLLENKYIDKSTSAFRACRDIAVEEALKFMPSLVARAINCQGET